MSLPECSCSPVPGPPFHGRLRPADLSWAVILRTDQLCPSGVAGVETYATFGNGCIGKCTLGIYAPRTIKVTCSAGGAHNFYLDKNDNVLAHETITPDGETTVEDFTSDAL